MITIYRHQQIEIEVAPITDANHEIEQAYLKAFINPVVHKYLDTKGNVFKLVIANGDLKPE